MRTRNGQALQAELPDLREVGLHPVRRWAARGELAGEDPRDLAVVHPAKRDGAPLGVVLGGHGEEFGLQRELAAGRNGLDLEGPARADEGIGDFATVVALRLANGGIELDVDLRSMSEVADMERRRRTRAVE